MKTNKKDLPKFQEYMLNEIYKMKGDATALSLEERLEYAYKIIKSNILIYNKFEKNSFFKNFLMASKVLVFQSDKNKLIDIVNISYEVLKSKENIQEDYEEIIKELNNNGFEVTKLPKYRVKI